MSVLTECLSSLLGIPPKVFPPVFVQRFACSFWPGIKVCVHYSKEVIGGETWGQSVFVKKKKKKKWKHINTHVTTQSRVNTVWPFCPEQLIIIAEQTR